jgi:hypothetical protein
MQKHCDKADNRCKVPYQSDEKQATGVITIKQSFATILQKIYYVLIIIATCFGLFIGHPQVILTILNIKIKVIILTTDPLCIAKSNCMYYSQRLPLSTFFVNFHI